MAIFIHYLFCFLFSFALFFAGVPALSWQWWLICVSAFAMVFSRDPFIRKLDKEFGG